MNLLPRNRESPLYIQKDLSYAFRTGKSNANKQRIIIVKFLSQSAKKDIYRTRIKLRKKKPADNDAQQNATNDPVANNQTTTNKLGIYINEDLIMQRSAFYQSIRDVILPKKWPAWTENEVVWIRNSITGPALKIITTEDLDKIIQSAPKNGT